MASKLQKLQGIPRVAENDFQWKGFRIRKGYAFGIDDQGNLFVSPCMRADDGGLFLWLASDETPVVCRRKEEVRGHFSGCIGSRSIIMEAGYYATEWGLRWKPASIPVSSALAQRIIEAKRKAKPCAHDPYRGLMRMCPSAI